jgi:hypothetical protein
MLTTRSGLNTVASALEMIEFPSVVKKRFKRSEESQVLVLPSTNTRRALPATHAVWNKLSTVPMECDTLYAPGSV